MANTSDNSNDPNLALRAWTKISDETNIRVEMVGHIHLIIAESGKDGVAVKSENATQVIIQGLLDNDNGSIQSILSYNGIQSSEDLGTVVRKLCAEGLLIQEEHDRFEDFNGRFTTTSIDDYIRQLKLKKKRDWYRTVAYSLYVTGFVIVVASYTPVISNEVGWLGWGLGMTGWLLLTYKASISARLRKWRRPDKS